MKKHNDPTHPDLEVQLPHDIPLGESERNWIQRKRASEPHHSVRRLAADSATRAAIGGAY